MTLSREEILKAIAERQDQIEPIEVPEWGGTVYVRRLSVGDLKRAGKLGGEGDSTWDALVRTMVLGLAAEDGSALFTKRDAEELMKADYPVVLAVVRKINRINSLTSEAAEEDEESFGGAQTGASSTD